MIDERRLDARRMAIEKRVEILCPDQKVIYGGMSTNMSNAGLSGWFESAPEIGSDVTLRVYWNSGNAPVESSASLVWTEPTRADENGKVLVGLKVDRMSNKASSEETIQSEETVPTQPACMDHCLIEKGQKALLNTDGGAIETVVSKVGTIRDDQTVEVVLKITESVYL